MPSRIIADSRPSADSARTCRPSRAPLAHRADGGLEDLGEVAADLPLNPDGHHQPRDVLAGVALPDPFERVLQVAAEPGLGERAAQLAGHRLAALAHQCVDGLRQREAGAQRTDHELQGVRELLGERAGPATGAPAAGRTLRRRSRRAIRPAHHTTTAVRRPPARHRPARNRVGSAATRRPAGAAPPDPAPARCARDAPAARPPVPRRPAPPAARCCPHREPRAAPQHGR